eukprot:NODE_447_length_2226_cov_90.739876_g415_i0.p1 GENE.NODE_447_length_2226_cov_90.739876_g415_i0~~NODE_447_length_2226_cov_90.739876_g415_i0.p1  ORF type:complete len:614 (+),score=95.95 NODE_447_length_2226_cov_90.739876_g415_i0:59-1900(+)
MPPKSREVDVIDVTTKSTIKVPLDQIELTSVTSQLLAAYENPEANTKCSFTLCELYQRGKCERKEGCRHVHVDPEYLKAKRETHFTWMQSNADTFARLPNDKTFEVFNATIKEVMHVRKVHLEYTRGLFLSSEDRDKRISGSVPSNSYSGKVPTACLLFLNGSCKWGEHCNQAHISRKWLQGKNREFQRWIENRKADFYQLSHYQAIDAYHPNLYEIIKIPKQNVVQFTRGLYQGGDKVPSVCLLFQKGKCSCGELCKQIHISNNWVSQQRKGHSHGRRRREGYSNDSALGNASPSSAAESSPGGSSMTSFRASPSLSPSEKQGKELADTNTSTLKRSGLNADAPPFVMPTHSAPSSVLPSSFPFHNGFFSQYSTFPQFHSQGPPASYIFEEQSFRQSPPRPHAPLQTLPMSPHEEASCVPPSLKDVSCSPLSADMEEPLLKTPAGSPCAGTKPTADMPMFNAFGPLPLKSQETNNTASGVEAGWGFNFDVLSQIYNQPTPEEGIAGLRTDVADQPVRTIFQHNSMFDKEVAAPAPSPSIEDARETIKDHIDDMQKALDKLNQATDTQPTYGPLTSMPGFSTEPNAAVLRELKERMVAAANAMGDICNDVQPH